MTHAGPKELNQDYVGYYIPTGNQRFLKGAAFAIADGISSSPYSQLASETAVNSFLNDYFCTSDAWTVKHAAECVIMATNSWLYSQGQSTVYKYEKDKGYVCTFSALILKGHHAHIFHVGDTRIYRLRENYLELLTNDHRVWKTEGKSFLSRALGVSSELEIDYRSVPVAVDDIFLLTSDGLHEFVSNEHILEIAQQPGKSLQCLAQELVDTALANGAEDNVTVQLVKADALAVKEQHPMLENSRMLELPPPLEPGMRFDGFTILSTLYISSRSHVFLALDNATQTMLILKTPSVEMSGDDDYLERFIREEWIARRVNSQYVVKAIDIHRSRQYIYTLTEFVDGRTLRQWLVDNPKPALETVRRIVEQIAKGLMALHRKDMLHQDLKPENIMIDSHGMVKIIDFGAVRIAGLEESFFDDVQPPVPGTAMFAAPEYFLGEVGTTQSDLFSLAMLTYHMLSGSYPYGADVARTRTVAEQRRLQYTSVLHEERDIPTWIDTTLKKALHPNPHKRYSEISEFLYDLRQPGTEFLAKSRPPLIERNPVRFWQWMSFILFSIIVIQAAI